MPRDRALLIAIDTAIVAVAVVVLYFVALLWMESQQQPDQPTVITTGLTTTPSTVRTPVTVCGRAFSC